MSFPTAFAKTMGHEGTYSNDPDDRGGETYMGISRVGHPLWDGWQVLDRCVNANDKPIPSAMETQRLLLLVQEFYRAAFWGPLGGDNLPSDVGEELFDSAVNMGLGTATRFLQQALNMLNRNGMTWPDLREDGQIGPKTLTIVRALSPKDANSLLKLLNVLQGMRYIEILRKNPSQEKYARGWFERVILTA